MVTRRVLLKGAFAGTAAGLLLPTMTTTSTATERGPAVWLIPHQDDEVLTHGSAIKIHVEAGRQVRLVLFGQGETSVRTGQMPELLGYTPSLEEMSAVRDREFTLTAERFEVGAENAITWPMSERLPEKSVHWSVEGCENMIRRVLSIWPDADLKANSPFDSNPDHSNIGKALNNMWHNGEIPFEPRFYLSPWDRGVVPHPELREEKYTGYMRKKRMQYWYRYSDIATGYWGVGYRSVPGLFDSHAQDHTSYMHRVVPTSDYSAG